MKGIFVALVGALLSTSALAADLATAVSPVIPLKAPAVVNTCTVTACTGAYLGGDIAMAGLTLDVLGTALAGPTPGTTNGASAGIMAGYQYWQSGLYAGVQGIANFSFSNPDPLGGNHRFFTAELMQVGGNLAGLFSPGQTAPTQGPITLNIPGLALMSPFAVVGAGQRGRNGLATGAGAEFVAGPGWNIIVEYLHVNYAAGQPVVPMTATQQTEDLVVAGLVKKFSF